MRESPRPKGDACVAPTMLGRWVETICSNLFQFRCISGRFLGSHCVKCPIDLVDALYYGDQPRATTRDCPYDCLFPWAKISAYVQFIQSWFLPLTGQISWNRWIRESPLRLHRRIGGKGGGKPTGSQIIPIRVHIWAISGPRHCLIRLTAPWGALSCGDQTRVTTRAPGPTNSYSGCLRCGRAPAPRATHASPLRIRNGDAPIGIV